MPAIDPAGDDGKLQQIRHMAERRLPYAPGRRRGAIFIVVLGTQASGSTWLYNVARLLLRTTGRPLACASADDGVSVLDQLSSGAEDVVIKSHGMDQRFFKLARAAGARVLVSTRDPRDAVVSQRERFGLSLQRAVAEMSRAFATIASLPGDLATLRFDYERGFTGRVETVRAVADFIGVTVDDAAAAAIFAALEPDSVRAHIANWLTGFPTGDAPGHDPVTQWHVPHVGDGVIGKWADRLDAPSQAVVRDCLGGMDTLAEDRQALFWHPALFSYGEGAADDFQLGLSGGDRDRLLSYGPYHCLPRGRWCAHALVRADERFDGEVEAEIFLPWEDRVVAARRAPLEHRGSFGFGIRFDHRDHFQPVEARLKSSCRNAGTLAFEGWRLRWLGNAAD